VRLYKKHPSAITNIENNFGLSNYFDSFVFQTIFMEGLTERLHRIERKIEERFDRLESLIIKHFHHMANEIANLQAAVANEVTVEQSAITLLQQIAEQLKNATDLSQVQALADQINASATALSAAVVANTPAAPTT